jgi:hypothetical protein
MILRILERLKDTAKLSITAKRKSVIIQLPNYLGRTGAALVVISPPAARMPAIIRG